MSDKEYFFDCQDDQLYEVMVEDQDKQEEKKVELQPGNEIIGKEVTLNNQEPPPEIQLSEIVPQISYKLVTKKKKEVMTYKPASKIEQIV